MMTRKEKKEKLNDLEQAFWTSPEDKTGWREVSELSTYELRETFVGDDWIMDDPDNRNTLDIILDDEWCQQTCMIPEDKSQRNLFDRAYDKKVMSRLLNLTPQAGGDDTMTGNYARFNREGEIGILDIDGNLTTEVRSVKFGQFDRMISEECTKAGNEILIGQLIGPKQDSKPSHLRPEEIAKYARCTFGQAFHLARIYDKLDFTFQMAQKCNRKLAKRIAKNPWDEIISGGQTLRTIMKAVQELEEKGPEEKVQTSQMAIFSLLPSDCQLVLAMRSLIAGWFEDPPIKDPDIQSIYDQDRASRQRRTECAYTDFPKWSPYVDKTGKPYNSDPDAPTCEEPEVILTDEDGLMIGSDDIDDSGFTERACFTYWRLTNIPINKALQTNNARKYQRIITAMEKAVMKNDFESVFKLKTYIKKKGTFAQKADFQKQLIKIQERRIS